MAKKSRRVAARQAAIGKERKHKKLLRSHTGHERVAPDKPADVTVADTEVVTPPVTPAAAAPDNSLSAAPEPAARPQAQSHSSHAVAPSYRYVIAELRRVAILAGAVGVILIVLTFVLG